MEKGEVPREVGRSGARRRGSGLGYPEGCAESWRGACSFEWG